MKLQTILLPKRDDMKEMYYREVDNTFLFDTYFNLFSLKKWKKYTSLEQLYLKLRVRGKCQVNIFCDEQCKGRKYVDAIEEMDVIIECPVCETADILWFEVVNLSEENEMRVLSGEFGTNISEKVLNHVKLGIDICTYKREEYVKRNVELLKKNFLENMDSELSDHMEIFVIDNGRTIRDKLWETEKIHIFENKNLGGAGGFTRGLIEILKRREDHGFTHVIFMDDDADIEPDAIVRTYALLRLMKKEYCNMAIGGAMLRQDEPFVEHAAGEYWNHGRLYNPHFGWDLRKKEVCFENERELDCDYAGWWYCCWPLTVANEDNLPLPLFIHLDDVEYGLRNRKNHFLFMNGICIWHAYFKHRRPSQYEYYEVRNAAIIRLLHPETDELRLLKRSLFRRVTANVLRYRYQDVTLNCQAIKDLVKGVEWFEKQDGVSLHKRLSEHGYVSKDARDVIQKSEELQKVQRDMDLEFKDVEWIVPKGKEGILALPMGVNPYNSYLVKKMFLFNPENRKGILVQRSISALIRSYWLYWKTVRLLNRNYHRLQNSYQERSGYLMSIDFWEKYLSI